MAVVLDGVQWVWWAVLLSLESRVQNLVQVEGLPVLLLLAEVGLLPAHLGHYPVVSQGEEALLGP